MNLRYRPYSIYVHEKSDDRDGLWFRLKSFRTMASAMQALSELTRTRKEDRDRLYIILPNENSQHKYILFKDEHVQNILDNAK